MNQDSKNENHEFQAQDNFEVQVSDESFNFHKIYFQDKKVTGAQIAMKAGVHPVEEYIILQWLGSFELETIRPSELIDLNSPAKIFIIKGSVTYHFIVDGLNMEWPCAEITGDKIKRLVGYHPADGELLLECEKTPDETIQDNQDVHLNNPGVERFKIHQLPLVIEVDGVEYHPSKSQMTPNEIIIMAAHLDAAQNYLNQIFPIKESYKGKGDILISLHRGMRFNIIELGPTTVSDPNQIRGVEAFLNGLRALGFNPEQLPKSPNCILFDYTVECGKFCGTKVRIGLKIPSDFPATPPTGPCISPEIHPVKSGGTHPSGGIHKGQWVTPFETEAGGKWQYWSRPCKEWNSGTGSVHAYMAHIAKLWVTQ